MPQPIALTSKHTLCLHPTSPFDFDATVHKPSHFPSSDVAYAQGVCWQTMCWEGEVLGLKLEGGGTVENPEVALTIHSRTPLPSTTVAHVAAEAGYRMDLAADLSAFYQACTGDELLTPAIARRRGMRVSALASLYEYLVIAIVLQNATVRRSVQMLENLYGAYGSRVSFDGRELSAFWPPAALHRASEEEVRALKVGYRAKALWRISAAFAEGEIDELALRALGKEEVRRRLLSLYGVGPASVGYLLFDVFHHYDALDHLPPWEQRIYSRLLFSEELVPAERILDEVRRRWGPWRMLAAHYVFEDLFWRHGEQPIPWLQALIRL